MLISAIAKKMNACFVGHDQMLGPVSSDTRTLLPGDFFVVLKGKNFDAHDFLPDAVSIGIKGALISNAYFQQHYEQVGNWGRELAFIVVADTGLGLGQLGKVWAEQFNIPKIAITGSCGKTTVKEMIASILRQSGEVLATEGNKNNDIGVPLTLLRLRERHQFAVIEMGANHQGEIAYTTSLVRSDAAVINNAAGAHLEGFGSIEGVAKAKGEIYTGLKEEGVAVLNADDNYYSYWKGLTDHKKQLSFSVKGGADVCLASGELHKNGTSSLTINYLDKSFSIRLHLLGKHNWTNALAATSLALAIGVSGECIAAGLESLKPISGRMEPFITPKEFLLVNDAYNANPFSVKAAIDVLAQYKGQRILVLGDMGELGGQSQKLHEEVGAYAKEMDIDRLLVTGQFAAHTAAGFGVFATVYKEVEQIIEEIGRIEGNDFTVLVKGSRGARMERVIKGLLKEGSV